MELFPGVDPIPLPAPVWLFKVLHLLTLSLHLVAVHLLLGGLAVATWWAFAGYRRQDATAKTAAGLIAHRLPVVMAYVINLGVPPLLFTQVLYGRALYTSSVLMGTWWLAVIFLVIGSYYALYAASKRSEVGSPWGSVSLLSLLLALLVAYIYTNNMTLMLRPQAWQEMYRADALGVHLNGGDPTVLPRWLFMLAGSLAVAGVGMTLLARKGTVAAEARALLARRGAALAAAAWVVQAALGWWVLSVQPAAVRDGLGEHALYRYALWAWLLTGAGLVVAALLALRGGAGGGWLRVAPLAGLGVLNVGAMVIVRDGVRDLTLMAFGFNVWQRTIVTNWSVVGLFLVLFVLGLGTVGWMIRLTAQARAVEERYA